MPVPDEALPELTFNDQDVERILRDPDTYPQAVEALTQIRVGREKLNLSADDLDTSSTELGIDRAELWIQVLRHKGCLSTLVVALRARGILLADAILVDAPTLPKSTIRRLGAGAGVPEGPDKQMPETVSA
ncbi:hypothetical protein [Pseudomonas rubra]|uniref:Uncharacterized protein n=1 Tax=Pseudomonas rubra TaxID=2942627 RepID=A0ABT5PA91_9PSED|nr:hypothetical protein [Pseudomonas rubra]MDD1015188.1 hypothetical protein [Pseudomonas rubra]MDD1037842.1 hypothetical protein [Pseudomonas rubra]MDD1152829.1 hypothetical protein [Pseudomonas rubra]